VLFIRQDNSLRRSRCFPQPLTFCVYTAGCQHALSAVGPFPCTAYLHATVVEIHCLPRDAEAAIAAVASSPGVYWIEPKSTMTTRNWSGRSIIGTGTTQTFTSASQPNPSKVFSSVSMQNSIIGTADSGLSINNCYFCSLDSSAFHFYAALNPNTKLNKKFNTIYNSKHSDQSMIGGTECESATGSANARNVKKCPLPSECFCITFCHTLPMYWYMGSADCAKCSRCGNAAPGTRWSCTSSRDFL
jgi:hypothetical protein